MSALWFRAASQKQLWKNTFTALITLLLKLKISKLETVIDTHTTLRLIVKTHSTVLLTKLFLLSSISLLVRAVSSLGLHETPAASFFGVVPASKLCVRIIIQTHATVKNSENTNAQSSHEAESTVQETSTQLSMNEESESYVSHTCSVLHPDSAQAVKYDKDWSL